MSRLAPQVLDEILERTDIVALVGQYLRLRPAGKNFIGLCPFHQEKTPSFTVSPEKNLWHCFGCGQGGNIFSFLMKVENIPFREAAERLAAKAGVRIVTSEAETVTRTRRDAERDLMAVAARFFQACLVRTPPGQEAAAYLEKRGIGSGTRRLFEIGYAPASSDALLTFLGKRGADLELACQTGLLRRQRDSGAYRDYFRHRLMFPIWDTQGRVIAFGARALDDSPPKYLNSPESALFSKGRGVYALHLARPNFTRSERVLVVEGYMDVLALFQAGINWAVASMGTALTIDQARLISRYCRKVVLAYDADIAGAAATERGIDIFEQAGLEARILRLPNGHDPDSFVRDEGVKAFLAQVDSALPIFDYKLHTLSDKHDLSRPEGKAAAAREMEPMLLRVIDLVKRDAYVQRVAERLGVPEETLRRAARLSSSRADTGSYRSEPAGAPSAIHAATRRPGSLSFDGQLLRLVLHHPEFIDEVRRLVEPDDLDDPWWSPAWKALLAIDPSGPMPAPGTLVSLLEDEGMAPRLTELLLSEEPPVELRPVLDGLIRKIKDRRLRSRYRELQQKLAPRLTNGELDSDDPDLVEFQSLARYFKGGRS